MNFTELSNGVKMPRIGYGVYQIEKKECERCVLDALEIGYRLIDTAQAYYNEEEVGLAVKKSGIKREDIFITSKIWISNEGYEKAKRSIDESLRRLNLDCIDLLLIHQPFGDYYGTYRAMEEAYKNKKLRAIGVSNFYPDRLIDICKFVDIKPMVNQIETHVFNQQKEAHEIMNKYNIVHESWGPFAEGRKNFFDNKILMDIGKKYNKTVGQVALRFLFENDIVVIPKSVHKNRMQENFDIFDFELEKEDLDIIKNMDERESAFFSHYDSQMVEWLTSV